MQCLGLSSPDLCSHGNGRIPLKWIPGTSPVGRKVGEELTLVFVPPHPVIKHWLSVLRNELSPTHIFRGALAELGRFLIYEAARDWLVTVTGEVQTPYGVANVEFIDPREPVRVIPILRAGLVLVEHVSSVLPTTQTYHIGFLPDESSHGQTFHFSNSFRMTEKFPDGVRVLIADPILSTGEATIAIIDMLKQRNIDHRLIRVISAVAAPPALDHLSKRFPGIRVYTGTVDEVITERGDVIPGIGDAASRSYGL